MKTIFRVTLSLLVGLISQVLFVGFSTLSYIDFSSFDLFAWIMQALYIVFLISLPFYMDEENSGNNSL
jgi:hypothetical protein